MAVISYPFKDRFSASAIGDRTLAQRLVTWNETRKVNRREKRKHIDVSLTCISPQGQSKLRSDDLPLVFLTRNDCKLLPAFISHYQRLGVTRFICVDDCSTDGSREWLLQQTDVDVWVSPLRYKDARRGRAWREELFRLYGKSRWYINVDSDEFLVFHNFEERTLKSVIRGLEQAGVSRLPAPMLDLYPNSFEDADVNLLSSRPPWLLATQFDTSGYALTTTNRAISVKGGPRGREFASDLEMIKYPLIYWDDLCRFGPSVHQPLPYQRNFVGLMGVLLHFKFFSDYKKAIEEIVSDGQHFNGSAAYAKIAETISKSGELHLQSSVSETYTGSRQLLDLGFITELP